MDFHIYEVGPRDGLQGRNTITPTADKMELIDNIVKAGIDKIEVGSLVHPLLVPNMADSDVVYSQAASQHPNCELGVLIPNNKGMKRAKALGVQKYNIFMSPSESFNKNNHNDSSQGVFRKYLDALKGIRRRDVRVYLSCIFGCPMDGEIEEEALIKSLERADYFGKKIVLSDTAGLATPDSIQSVIQLANDIGVSANMALHLHHDGSKESMGEKLDMAYSMGVREFDSSIGGLGGCPFVTNSGGNLATEELVEWGEKGGLNTSVNLDGLKEAMNFVRRVIRKGKEALPYSAQ